MDCHVEWIRNFLLRSSTIKSNYIPYLRTNSTKSSPYGELSALRFQLLKPGFSSFISHTFYSLTISIIDSNFSYENSNFSVIRSYLLQYLPMINVSINELESKQFSPSHYALCKSILTYYIRFYLKPSTISPTCYGSDIEAYEKSLYEWGRSICKSEIPYLPGNFMTDFGTAQVVSIILSKIHPELIQLSNITFSDRLKQSEIIRNWREVGTALNVIGVHVPTEKEWGDNLCLLCFGVDLFRAIYNKPNSSNLVEFQMKQNQINQQNNNKRNNYSNYCATDEINKIDFLIGQMNSISNGNPNVLLSEPYQQNPILVQQQRILQYQQQQQQLLQIQQQQQVQQLINQINQPQILYNPHDEIDTNTNPIDSRVRIVSIKKQENDNHNHFESKKIESPDKRRNIDDDLIYQRAKKYKLLSEFKSFEKQKENKKIKKSKEIKKTEKNEPVQNFKIMSSFAIDPSFPNQCKLTTYKEAIDPKMNENQFKKLQKFENFEKKKNKNKRNTSPDSSAVKCSYVTFENDHYNQNDQISSQKIHKQNSKKSKNHKKHQDSLIKKNSLFDDVIEADRPDFQNPKSSQDFQDIISKQKDEFKKKSQLSGNKNGTDLLTSINSFIEQQREAIAAASLAKKIENSKIKPPEPLPDFSQFDVTQPESIKVFDTDPILLINSKSKEFEKDNRKKIKNAKNSEITSQLEINDKNKSSIKLNDKSSSSSSTSSLSSHSVSKEKPTTIGIQKENKNDSSFSDPLLNEFSKNERKNKDKENSHSHSHSSIKSNSSSSSSSSKRNKKIESEKVDHFNDLNSPQKVEITKNDSEMSNEMKNQTDNFDNEKTTMNQQNKDEQKSNSIEIIEEEEEAESSEIEKPDLFNSNKNMSQNISHIKNSSRMDDFSMKSELTFPDIPSLIDPSFRFDQTLNDEKAQNSNKIPEKDSNHEKNQNKPQNSEQNASKIMNSSKFQNSEQNASKIKNSSKIQNSEQNSSNLINSNKTQKTEQSNNKINNSSNLHASSKFQNSEQNLSNLHNSNKPQNSEQNSSNLHNSNKAQNTEQDSNNLHDISKIQNTEQNSSILHASSKTQPNFDQNSSSFHNSAKEFNKEQLSDTEKKSFSNKRPIPHPPSPLASPNSNNFLNSSSKLPFLTKTNSQKSESMTPPELSIVSGFEIDSVSHKQESESLTKPSNKSLNDDNELSIDQNSSEIKTNASNSIANSDSFGQSTIKRPSNVHSSDSKQTNSILENSQSSNKIESAVEEFIPEIERFSSGNEQKKKKTSNENSQNNDNNGQIKKFHSSSSSSDSIPFKVIHSDSEKNTIENNRKSEEDINDNQDKKDDSKPFTSVIEEFDLSSIKPSKRKQVPIQSISGPIILNEEPIPKTNQNKGPSSETKRVSFSLGVKGFAPPQPNQFSASANIAKLNKNYSSTTNSSLNFNDNDVDTFMSTASMSHSMTIPIEERLKMYSKDHNELSLPFSDPEPEIIQEYRDVSTANVGKKYIWLSNDEQALLENVLPTIVGKSDIQDINTFISKELKMPKSNSSVHRIAANIKAFLLSRGQQNN